MHYLPLHESLSACTTLVGQLEILGACRIRYSKSPCCDDEAARMTRFVVSAFVLDPIPLAVSRALLSLHSALRSANAPAVDSTLVAWLVDVLHLDRDAGMMSILSCRIWLRILEERSFRAVASSTPSMRGAVEIAWRLLSPALTAAVARLRKDAAVSPLPSAATAAATASEHVGLLCKLLIVLLALSGGVDEAHSESRSPPHAGPTPGETLTYGAQKDAPQLVTAILTALACPALRKDGLTQSALSLAHLLRSSLCQQQHGDAAVTSAEVVGAALLEMYVPRSQAQDSNEEGAPGRCGDSTEVARTVSCRIAGAVAGLSTAAQIAVARGLAVAFAGATPSVLGARIRCPTGLFASAQHVQVAESADARATDAGRRQSLLGSVLMPLVVGACEAPEGTLRTYALQALESLLHAARRRAGHADAVVGEDDGLGGIDQRDVAAVTRVVLTAWTAPERRTASLMPVLFDAILDLQQHAQQVVKAPDGTSTRGGVLSPSPLALHLLHGVPTTIPARSLAIARLLPRTGALQLLSARPGLCAELVAAAATPGDPNPAPTDLLKSLLIALRRELEVAHGLPAGAPGGDTAPWRRGMRAGVAVAAGDGPEVAGAARSAATGKQQRNRRKADADVQAAEPSSNSDIPQRRQTDASVNASRIVTVRHAITKASMSPLLSLDPFDPRLDILRSATAAEQGSSAAASDNETATISRACATLAAVPVPNDAGCSLCDLEVVAATRRAATVCATAVVRSLAAAHDGNQELYTIAVVDELLSAFVTRLWVSVWLQPAVALCMHPARFARSRALAYVLPAVLGGDVAAGAALTAALRRQSAALMNGQEWADAEGDIASPASAAPDERATAAILLVARLARAAPGVPVLEVDREALLESGSFATAEDGGVATALLSMAALRAALLLPDPELRVTAAEIAGLAPGGSTAARGPPSRDEYDAVRLFFASVTKAGGASSEMRKRALRLLLAVFARIVGGLRHEARIQSLAEASAAHVHAGDAGADAVADAGGLTAHSAEPERQRLRKQLHKCSAAAADAVAFVKSLLHDVLQPCIYNGATLERVSLAVDALRLTAEAFAGKGSASASDGIAATLAAASVYTSEPAPNAPPPGANADAQRVSELLHTLFPSNVVLRLINLCTAPWERVRAAAAATLTALPAPLFGLTTPDTVASLTRWAVTLTGSPRQRECDGGALLLRIVFEHYVVHCGWTISLQPSVHIDTPALNGSNTPPHSLDATHQQLRFLGHLLQLVRARVHAYRTALQEHMGVVTAFDIFEASDAAPDQPDAGETMACEHPLAHGAVLALRYALRVVQLERLVAGRDTTPLAPWRELLAAVLTDTRAAATLAQEIVVGSREKDHDSGKKGAALVAEGEDGAILLAAGRIDCSHRQARVPERYPPSSYPSVRAASALSSSAPEAVAVADREEHHNAGDDVPGDDGIEPDADGNDGDGDDGDGDDGDGFPMSTGGVDGAGKESPSYILVVGAWLLTREVALLQAEIISNSPLPQDGVIERMADVPSTVQKCADPVEGPWLVSSASTAAAGDALLSQLLVVKHYGAMHHAAAALTDIAARLLRLPAPPTLVDATEDNNAALNARATVPLYLSQLPHAWLDALLYRLTRTQSQFILRRSAGFAAAFVALLEAEAARSNASPTMGGKTMLQRAVETLLAAAGGGNATPAAYARGGTDMGAVPVAQTGGAPTAWRVRVHALNVLRLLFKHSPLGDAIIPWVPAGIAVAVSGFSSPAWGVRNSSMMLFAAATERSLGTVHRNIGAVEDGVKRLRWCGDIVMSTATIPHGADAAALSVSTFFKRFPALHALIVSELRSAVDSAEHGVHPPALYPILLLLSRMRADALGQHATQLGGDAVVADADTLGALSPTHATRSTSDNTFVACVDDAVLGPLLLHITTSARHALVRRMASRAYAALLPPGAALVDAIATLVITVPQHHKPFQVQVGGISFTRWNAVHGLLLAIRAVLSRLNSGDGESVDAQMPNRAHELRRKVLIGCAPLTATVIHCHHNDACSPVTTLSVGAPPDNDVTSESYRVIPGLVRAVAMDVCALAEHALPQVSLPNNAEAVVSPAALAAAAALGLSVSENVEHSYPVARFATKSGHFQMRLNLGDGVLASSAARTLADDIVGKLLCACPRMAQITPTLELSSPASTLSSLVPSSSDLARLKLLQGALAHLVDEARVAAVRSLKAAMKHCTIVSPKTSIGSDLRRHTAVLQSLRAILFSRVAVERHPDAARYCAAALLRLLLRQRALTRALYNGTETPSRAAECEFTEWAALLDAHDASRDTDTRAHLLRTGAALLPHWSYLVSPTPLLASQHGITGQQRCRLVSLIVAWTQRASVGAAALHAHRLRLAAARAIGESGILALYLQTSRWLGSESVRRQQDASTGSVADSDSTLLLDAGAMCFSAIVTALVDFDDEVRDAARAAVQGALHSLVAHDDDPGTLLFHNASRADAPPARVELRAVVAEFDVDGDGRSLLPGPMLRDIVDAAVGGGTMSHNDAMGRSAAAASVTDAAALHLSFTVLAAFAWKAPQTLQLLSSIASGALSRGQAADTGICTDDAHGEPDYLHRTLFALDPDNDFEEPVELASLAARALTVVLRRLHASRGISAPDPSANTAYVALATAASVWATRHAMGTIADAHTSCIRRIEGRVTPTQASLLILDTA